MRSILSFCQGFVEKAFDRGDVLLAEGEKEGILYILIEGNYLYGCAKKDHRCRRG